MNKIKKVSRIWVHSVLVSIHVMFTLCIHDHYNTIKLRTIDDYSVGVAFSGKFSSFVNALYSTPPQLCYSHTVANILANVKKYIRGKFARYSGEYRAYGEWAYECNSPPIAIIAK